MLLLYQPFDVGDVVEVGGVSGKVDSVSLVSTTITLSKTMRDEHESRRLINKISDAKTKQLIKEFAE